MALRWLVAYWVLHRPDSDRRVHSPLAAPSGPSQYYGRGGVKVCCSEAIWGMARYVGSEDRRTG